MNKISSKALGLIMVCFFLTFTLSKKENTSMDGTNIQYSLSINEVLADPATEHVRMGTHTCWVNGQQIDYCEYDPNYLCDASAQGTCSGSDPGESN